MGNNSYLGLCPPIIWHILVSFGDIHSLWWSMPRSINLLLLKKKMAQKNFFYHFCVFLQREAREAIRGEQSMISCLLPNQMTRDCYVYWIYIFDMNSFSATPLSLITYWCFQYIPATKQLLHLFWFVVSNLLYQPRPIKFITMIPIK